MYIYIYPIPYIIYINIMNKNKTSSHYYIYIYVCVHIYIYILYIYIYVCVPYIYIYIIEYLIVDPPMYDTRLRQDLRRHIPRSLLVEVPKGAADNVLRTFLLWNTASESHWTHQKWDETWLNQEKYAKIRTELSWVTKNGQLNQQSMGIWMI